MFAKVYSLGVFGMEGYRVTVEVDVSGGLPQFSIVGLPDSAVKESADRVRSALKNTGFKNPVSRVTVNLAPADMKKTGPVYDLPILLGLLLADGQIEALPPSSAFIGELSLNGDVRAVGAAMPMAVACAAASIENLYLPKANALEAALVPGINVYAVDNITQLIRHIKGDERITKAQPVDMELGIYSGICDYSDVQGQHEARRAMEIAAAGGHNVILVGSPGAGKSMIAKRLPGILPPLDREQAIQTSMLYSIAGVSYGQNENGAVLCTRPFRSPHHSASPVSISGGGSKLKPGEISLAHNGVLFLDELPEFKRDTLEVLRQPMEDGRVSISRVVGTAEYPCRFMLVAAMNPCPCGYFGHPTRECRCDMNAIDKYLKKISGPLLDRIDLHVEVLPVEYNEIGSDIKGETSAEILKRVVSAREFMKKRHGKDDFVQNSELDGDLLRSTCRMTDKAGQLLESAFKRMSLSARGYVKVMRVSRTIADLDSSEIIDVQHVSEAVQYRNLDRKYWHTK